MLLINSYYLLHVMCRLIEISNSININERVPLKKIKKLYALNLELPCTIYMFICHMLIYNGMVLNVFWFF